MKSITINVTPDDIITLDQVTRYLPLASRHLVSQAALRLGLVQMASDQQMAIEQIVAQHQARQGDAG